MARRRQVVNPYRDATTRGLQFEEKVRLALRELLSVHPDHVQFYYQPPLKLRTGVTKKPDFILSLNLPHEVSYYTIECQDRTKSSQGIIDKIRHMREASALNTFLFVYGGRLPRSLIEPLKADGVNVRSYGRFLLFLDGVHKTLGKLDGITREPVWVKYYERQPSSGSGIFGSGRLCRAASPLGRPSIRVTRSQLIRTSR